MKKRKSIVPDWRNYVSCPHCTGSFSFRKPTCGTCPWCAGSLPPKPGEIGHGLLA